MPCMERYENDEAIVADGPPIQGGGLVGSVIL